MRTGIVVETPVERAFTVLVEQFDRIKPREHDPLGAVESAGGRPLYLQRYGDLLGA